MASTSARLGIVEVTLSQIYGFMGKSWVADDWDLRLDLPLLTITDFPHPLHNKYPTLKPLYTRVAIAGVGVLLVWE